MRVNVLFAKLIVALMWLASLFSRRDSVRIARMMAYLARGSETAKITRINLETCFPDLSDEELNRLVQASLMNMALMFFELGQIRRWPYEKISQGVVLNGEEVLQRAAESPNGVLLIIPHLGNWEILSVYLGLNYRLAALYDPPKFAGLESVIVGIRERYSGEMFPIDVGGLRNIMKWLRNGGLVALLPDQVPDRNAGVYADFFGQPALTMNLVHQLVSRTHPQVVLGWVRRKFEDMDEGGGYGYEVNFSPLSLTAEDQVETATAINKAIEAAIRKAPAQYQWEYKRFKRPPEQAKASIYRRQ